MCGTVGGGGGGGSGFRDWSFSCLNLAAILIPVQNSISAKYLWNVSQAVGLPGLVYSVFVHRAQSELTAGCHWPLTSPGDLHFLGTLYWLKSSQPPGVGGGGVTPRSLCGGSLPGPRVWGGVTPRPRVGGSLPASSCGGVTPRSRVILRQTWHVFHLFCLNIVVLSDLVVYGDRCIERLAPTV